MSSSVNDRSGGFSPLSKLAIAKTLVTDGGFGPLGKIVVARDLINNARGESSRVNQTATPVIQNTQDSQSGSFRERASPATTKFQEIGEKKEEAKEIIEQLQTAAVIGQGAGLVITAVGAASYFYKSSWAFAEMGFGAALFFAGVEAETIQKNIKAIMDTPLAYKEFPSGKWKVEEVGKRLKKDLLISGWVVDTIIIPQKFK